MAQIIDYNCKVVNHSTDSLQDIWNDDSIPFIKRYSSSTESNCKITHTGSITIYVAYSIYDSTTDESGAVLLWAKADEFVALGGWRITTNSGSYTAGVISRTWNTTEDGRYRYFLLPITKPVYYSDPSIVLFANTEIMVDTIFGDAPTEIPITYVPVNSILSGPAQANIGDAVEVDVSFPDGYKLKDATQGSGISVYNDNGYIDFTYDEATRKLNFIMPQ